MFQELNPVDALCGFLVLGNYKPAGQVVGNPNPLMDVGLACEVFRMSEEDQSTVIFSQNPELSYLCAEAWTQQDCVALGRLFGYPECLVQAFKEGAKYLPSQLARQQGNQPDSWMRFNPFTYVRALDAPEMVDAELVGRFYESATRAHAPEIAKRMDAAFA